MLWNKELFHYPKEIK